MRTTLLTVVVLAMAVCVSAARQRSASVDPAAVAFGYTDNTGSKLLVLPEMDRNSPIPEARARGMAQAVCADGRVFPIRYVQYQKRTAADSGRKSSYNFSNDEGHLLEIAQGQAAPDDTCLLLPAGYLQSFPVSPFQPLGEFAKGSLTRVEKEKGRTAKIYWPLRWIDASSEVAAVEFSAMGDSMLGSLVLVEPARLFFFDMPASLKQGREDGGCWRVDDECEFQYRGMNVPAVLGASERRLVFFTFQGAEGQVIVLFEARDGKLVELQRNYRYNAAR